MKKQLFLAVALSLTAVIYGRAQGTVGFYNNTSSLITTNSIENSVTAGLTSGGLGGYYYALLYDTAGSATVGGSTAAISGKTGATYAFSDSNWHFSANYATNTATAGRLNSTTGDAQFNTVVNGVAGGSSAQFVVIGWSANIGSTLAALQAWYANPTFTGWIGESIVGGSVATGAGLGFPPGLFGKSTGNITGFTLGEVPVTVPEPATIALIGIGSLGLAMIRRRK